MPRFTCDFQKFDIKALDWDDALDFMDCASCAVDCGGPIQLPEETPGQMQLPFNTNPKEEF